MNTHVIKKILLAVGAIVIFWYLQNHTALRHYLSFAYVKEQSSFFRVFVQDHYWISVALYMGAFCTLVACSFPISIVFTLLSGYLFGTFFGALFSVLSVTVGVAISYMVYRQFFSGPLLQQRYAKQAETFQKSMKHYGVSYLLMLHFSAVFPYFVINSIAAIARVPFVTVVWTTALGFIPQAYVYAFAGKELGSIEKVSDIFSQQVIIAFILLVLLACVPMLVTWYKKKMA